MTDFRKIMVAGIKDINQSTPKKIDGKLYKYAYSVYSENQREESKRQLERSGLSYRFIEKKMFGKIIGYAVYVTQSGG